MKEKILEFYNKLDALQREHNICNITINDGVCSCTKGRKGELCCSGCQYLGPTGCTIKCLACKLWFCNDILADSKLVEEHQEYFDEAKRIIKVCDTLEIPLNYREPTKELITP